MLRNRWTDTEITSLKDNFKNLSFNDLAIKLSPHTVSSIKDKAVQLRLSKEYFLGWGADKKIKFIDDYSSMSTEKLIKTYPELDGRSDMSIYQIAKRASKDMYGRSIKRKLRTKFRPKYDAVRHLYSKYKGSAKERGYEFLLSEEEFRSLVIKNCNYCDRTPQQRSTYKDSIHYVNGVDRVNCEEGYYLSNCVPCCKHCNRAKMMHTVDQFKEHITSIYNFFVMGRN